MSSRISAAIVASVGLGLYRRLRDVPEEANDLIDIDDSEFRRLTPYDCFEYKCNLSEASSGGIRDRIGCRMTTVSVFPVTLAIDVVSFNLSRAGNLLSLPKGSVV